jgi:hypothetical protein
MFVYPAGGQSTEQQAADEAECSTWAKAQGGAQPAPDTSTQAESSDDESRRDARRDRRDGSALRGAARGAVIGEALDDDEPEIGELREDIADDYDRPDSRGEVGQNVERALDDAGGHRPTGPTRRPKSRPRRRRPRPRQSSSRPKRSS